MSENETFERGPVHGQHSKRFYVAGTAVLVVIGLVGGAVLRPDGWHIARSMLGGVLIMLWSGFCVFAWHMLVGSAEEEEP